MGLFGKKKQKKQSKKQQKPKMVHNVTCYAPWDVPPTKGTYRLPAEHQAKIYTYYAEPLKKLKPEERFVLEAAPADVTIVSQFTNMEASTKDYGDIAYAYNGLVVGLSASHAEAVKKLLMKGYRVEVEAYISGYDDKLGFPYVYGLFGFVDDDLLYGKD